jgi:uncharacterized protein with FMN-binding domain
MVYTGSYTYIYYIKVYLQVHVIIKDLNISGHSLFKYKTEKCTSPNKILLVLGRGTGAHLEDCHDM